MKFACAFFLLASSVFAQTSLNRPMAACGPGNVSFKVALNNQLQALSPVAEGKARIYFIHEAGSLNSVAFAYPTVKYAIDGAWSGANHTDSWFSVPIDPGEHHLCTALQSSIVDDRMELAHFTAEPGKDYYFRTRLVMSAQVELLELEQIDSDQGRYLIGAFPLSGWKAKNELPAAPRQGRPGH